MNKSVHIFIMQVYTLLFVSTCRETSTYPLLDLLGEKMYNASGHLIHAGSIMQIWLIERDPTKSGLAFGGTFKQGYILFSHISFSFTI